MKTLLHTRTGFRFPTRGDWELSLSYDKKPKIWHRGEGSYNFKSTGPEAWVEEEIEDYSMEPDQRFCEPEKHAEWLKGWLAYAAKWGPACASSWTGTCGLYKVRDTFEKLSSGSLHPPAELSQPFQQYFKASLTAFSDARMAVLGGGWSLDLFKFLECIMRKHGESFEAFQDKEESAEQWIAEKYGDAAAANVKAILDWRVTDEQYQAHHAAKFAYVKLRDDAFSKMKKSK